MKVTDLIEGFSSDGKRFDVSRSCSVEIRRSEVPKADDVGTWELHDGGGFSETHRGVSFKVACKAATASFCRIYGTKFARLYLD